MRMYWKYLSKSSNTTMQKYTTLQVEVQHSKCYLTKSALILAQKILKAPKLNVFYSYESFLMRNNTKSHLSVHVRPLNIQEWLKIQLFFVVRFATCVTR